MKKNKTKTLLACAVLAGVLAGGMPSVQAEQVNAILMPKDLSNILSGKNITFGQKRGYVQNCNLSYIEEKPNWQIIAYNGNMYLLAKESWGKNRVSDTNIYHRPSSKYHSAADEVKDVEHHHYREVLNFFENNKGNFFTADELSLLGVQQGEEKRGRIMARSKYDQISEYAYAMHQFNSIFSLPSKELLNNLTADQRKRAESYWLNDCTFRQDGDANSQEGLKLWYDHSFVDTNGNYQVANGVEIKDFYPVLKIGMETSFAYYGDRPTVAPRFEKRTADSTSSVHLAFRNTQTEKDVQLKELEIAADKIKFTADGLATGTGQGLGGILADNGGNYLSYARLADTTSNSSVNATITEGSNKFLDNSQFAAGDYTVYLFNEKLDADSCFDYVGNFYKLPQVGVNSNGAITKAALTGNHNYTNLTIGENVDFDFTSLRYGVHDNGRKIKCDIVTVTDSLDWANVLNAEGSITLSGSFSVANDTLTLARPANEIALYWYNSIKSVKLDWNDMTYDGGEGKTATLHVNGDMHGLIVNGGTFIAEKDLKLSDYLRINNGATVKVNGKLNVALSGEIKGTLQTDEDLDVGGFWHVYNNNKITAPNINVKSTLMLDQDAVINGTCNVLDKGTLRVASNCSVKGLNFAGGSILQIDDGNKILDKAAITYTTDVHVDTNAKLTINNQKTGVNYKIFEKAAPALLVLNGPVLGSPVPNEIENYPETIEDWEKIVRSVYGLAIDLDSSVFSDEELTLCFEEDPNLSSYSDMSNIVSGLLNEPEGMAWIEDLSFMLALLPETDAEMYLEMLNNSVNTLANINTLANVQAGVSAISSFAGNSIQSNIGTGSRPMLGNRGQVSGVRKVSANEKDRVAIETVEQGKAGEVMPTQYEEQKYGKEVWASFIHNKEKIEGRKTGHLEQNSTMQYNGTVVGADLWSGKHGFGGVALTYGSSNIHSGQMISNVKNEADYYGINVYNRQDVGKFSFLYDGGFTYGKNDVTMSTLGEEDTTAKPKVRAYTLGLKVEEPIRIGGATELTPFVGARYTLVKTKEYQNSLGLGYDVDNQHLINMPVGLTIKGMYETKQGWKLGGTLTGGYCWNLGSKEGRQKVSFGGYSDMIDFDIADKGEYFIRPTLLAEKENLTFEVGYNYSKGKTTRSNKWYVNANIGF